MLVFVNEQQMNGHHNKNVKILILQFAFLPAIGSKQGSKLRIVLTVLYAEIGNRDLIKILKILFL